MATAAGAGSSAAAMSAEEAKLYDRQIRLWGVEAQRRMTASRVLVAGMDGMNAEVRCSSHLLQAVVSDSLFPPASHTGDKELGTRGCQCHYPGHCQGVCR